MLMDGFTLALLLTGTWGNLAKVLGKKVVIFVNACCLVLQACYFTAVCGYLISPPNWLH